MNTNKQQNMSKLYDNINIAHIYVHPVNEKCVFNNYGQCIKGFRYFCPYCNFGISGMFSYCQNPYCNIPKNNFY